MGEIVQFRSYTARNRQQHLSKNLDKEVEDIILNGIVEQTAQERKGFIEYYVQDVAYIDSIYDFESALQDLGEDLSFTMPSSYSQPYIILNPANRFFTKDQFPEVMDNMLRMVTQKYKNEDDFNTLTGSLLFYSLASKLFMSTDTYPSYQQKIITTHPTTDTITTQIQDSFPITNENAFKNLQDTITNEYDKLYK